MFNKLEWRDVSNSNSSLLLLGGGFLGIGLSVGSSGSTGLVLLGNGHSLSVLGQLVEHVAASATGVSVGVISHVCTYKLFKLSLSNSYCV